MSTRSIENDLDQLLGPGSDDQSLRERQAVARELYGIPDEMMTREQLVDLPCVDCTSDTLSRWEEEAEQEGYELLPRAIDHPGKTLYPPHSVLALLARRARVPSSNGNSSRSKSNGEEPDTPSGLEKSQRTVVEHDTTNDQKKQFEGSPDNWREV